ncbi:MULTISPECIES: translation elongation factor Ts [Pseudothermotoga]|jgi:elongation factor Ts|uniref:Elongation factor Ts n=1 Tax=Pseudothermotoga lettingae (strain ATCC BAA-301 / DSM 14385 / NBRC 107922 / TMO) TaxID=416591 RepID=EFTS_PSELT|nr:MULTISPECIES: translation elongation factor Ts [Pseudothermotoga]A8F4E2.1 RecName: Full=Elongation factor Ts; Short=EF-Ts [Pseudothermotoga lettingae TMO]ABV33026.1 translation elongation factor Ts [Pseudothermotoga lettingae TMO]KUK22074.1 MAG: Elongation factor T [Pseudothermotoga lettingae]MDI3494194.1 elongation factor Ts [Pseudothermotoga sp.]MDK2884032.1 elongation factor Ts [Pseudothermotoga sp.]GLI47972.1 elongation factor Ts [Pseudothermotoga lettingae TMO]
MQITADMVKKLREMTGAGVMECKTALTEADGDFEKAVEVLRKRGAAVAQKKAGRLTKEGIVTSYIHFNDKIGVLLELGCETDFVARMPEFKELAYNLAKHVAAMNPKYVTREDVPEEVLEKEKEIYRAQLENSNKPAAVVEKIVQGKLEKFYEEVCLYDQKYIFDDEKTVKEVVDELIGKIRENIRVTRFVRMRVGEE